MAKKSSHVEHEVVEVERDEMAVFIRDALNKESKDGSKVAFFLDEHEDPSNITDWVSTGSTLLDLAISNKKNGGLPAGRFVEISGLEGTGKSLVCAHLCAETQKRKGLAVMIDTESASAPEFWKAVGVDNTNLLYVCKHTVEGIFETIESIIGCARKKDPNRLVTIIVDSVAGASTQVEMESGHGKDGYATGKAIIISKAMRKLTGLIAQQKIVLVFTNQLRMNLGAGPFSGDKWSISGGKALAYACSVRIRLVNMAKIKRGDNIVGISCKATVTKNRLGPPFRKALFEIYYDSGIANLKSWLLFLKEEKLISGNKAGWTFVRKDGTELKLATDKFVDLINTDPTFKEEIYDLIADKYIMKYKDPNSKIEEDVSFDDDENPDDAPSKVVDVDSD